MLVVILISAGLCISCSEDSSRYWDPLSEECDQCLSQGGTEGCETLWRECDEISGCADYVLCQLDRNCYASPPDSGCEERGGCELAADAAEGAEEAAAAFEACARTDCSEACDYVAPQ